MGSRGDAPESGVISWVIVREGKDKSKKTFKAEKEDSEGGD